MSTSHEIFLYLTEGDRSFVGEEKVQLQAHMPTHDAPNKFRGCFMFPLGASRKNSRPEKLEEE
jgi:hypothetical protein